MATSNRKQRKVAFPIQSDKPSTSFKQSLKSRKLDFENVICVLELEPEDSGHKLLSTLTNNGKLSIISVISLSRSELKEIRVTDNNATTLAFDDWEVSEMTNVSSYFMHEKCENEDFQLKDIDPSSFESFKLSPICNRTTRTRKDVPRSQSTRGQPNLSRPSISPASNVNPEQETKPEPGGDSEPSLSMNQLFHQIMDPSPIANGEGGSFEPHENSSSSVYEELNGKGGLLEPCANSSSSFDKTINGKGGPPEPSETPSSCVKCSDIKCSDIDHKVKDDGSAKEIDSFSPTTVMELLCENDCVTPTHDHDKSTCECATPTCTCAAPTCNVQCSNPSFAPTAKLNKEADTDRSFERSTVSSNVVGRSLGQHHQAYDHSQDPQVKFELDNDKFLSQDPQVKFELNNDKFLSQDPQVKFELDLEAFESHLLKIRDDFSCSSYSSECTELSSCLRIEHVILDASKVLDEKLNEIMNFDSHSSSELSSLELLLHCDNMTKKPSCDHTLVEPLPQLDVKPQFFEEKWKPEGTHLPFKKRFTCDMKQEDLTKLQEVNNKPQEFIHHIDKKIQDNTTSATHDMTLNDRIQDDMTPSKKFSFNCISHSRPTSTCAAPTPKCVAISSTCVTPASKCATPSSNCVTPRSICVTATSDLGTPKKGISMNLVTPSPTSEESARSSTSNQVAHSSKYSSVASALVALNLASNAASHSSFRPKRRSHHSPTNTSIYPPLKRKSKASYFDSSSLPTSKKASVSRVKCASTPSFLQTLAMLPAESCLDPLSLKKNEILTSDESKLKKLRDLKKKLENRKLEDLFHGKKGSKSFIKNLSSSDPFTLCISSSILSSTAPIENTKVHRSSSLSPTSSSFDSFSTSKNHSECLSSCSSLSSETEFMKRKTSFETKKRDFSHLHSSRFLSTRKVSKHHVDSKHPSFNSSSSNLSHHLKKKILGPTKILDLSEPKNILGKTLGSNKTFSLSHLGTSTRGKPKVKSTKHSKSSFKTKPDEVSSSTYFTRSSSGTRNPTFLRLAHGEQPLYFIITVTLIILLLLHLFMIKLMHLPFDRGKETFIFICSHQHPMFFILKSISFPQ